MTGKTLTKRQVNALAKHSKHHTARHITSMKQLMKKGRTFTESHKITISKIGK